MKIKKIQLKNGYKRFFDLTIDLGDEPKKIIALVGSNGCGKSSVLDGLLFHSNAYYGSIGNKGAKDNLYHSMNQSPVFDYNNVIIELKDSDFGGVLNKKNTTGNQKTMFSFRSSYRYNSNLKITNSQAMPEIKLNNYGASASTDLDDKMDENYRRLNIKYNKYLNDSDIKPSEAKLKIIGDLNKAISNCLDLKISSIGNIEASQGTLYFIKNDHPKEFEFNVLSSGEKEVVDILLDLYLRQEEYNETIFLLDEPELHISTAIQKKLLLEINKLIGNNCQLWLTTHSIGFLRALQEDLKDECQIIQFNGTMNLASTKQTLVPMKKSIANWRKIFEIALDDLAHLVSPKQIIYCEGRDSVGNNKIERGLDAIVFNNIFSEKYHETLFISSGGNTELDQRSDIALAILTKVYSSLEILVLKDRDMSSGKLTTASERQIYLDSNPNHHRVLKRWEIENYLYDKEVLKKYCDDKSLLFSEIDYDAFVTNITDQNLKDETNRIKNYCGISTSVNPETFKKMLSNYISEDMVIYSELEDCIFKN
jgi:AAA domain, putative AbiEii toxin, Type IV TA system